MRFLLLVANGWILTPGMVPNRGMVAASESNKPLIGGLTFLGSTVFQISLGLIVKTVSGAWDQDPVGDWVQRHRWWALAILLLVSALLTSATLWFVSRRDPNPTASADLLDVAPRDLATNLRGQLEDEAQLRFLDTPRAIPLRWRNAENSLIDQWSNIRRDSASDLPIPMDGESDSILEVFRRVPSQRLVVLGDAGAGKSVLMTRFMRSLLAEERQGQPASVPVLFALATWDPTSTPFYGWLADELATQHPSLARRLPDGTTIAHGLIDAGRLIYVLDGLDEMPGGLRAEALDVMSASLRRSDGVLVSCRVVEYRAAVAASGPLTGAAAVVIENLRSSDVGTYLPSTTGDAQRGSRWTPVLCQAEHAAPGTPGAALRDVLRTPLMVNLARIVYQDPTTRPQDLLSYPEPAQIENLLLDKYVAAALSQGPVVRGRAQRSIQRTERYIAFIASYMTEQNTPYFRWWELHRSLSRADRISLAIVAGTIVTILAPPHPHCYPLSFRIKQSAAPTQTSGFSRPHTSCRPG
jgi:hypothetical protein